MWICTCLFGDVCVEIHVIDSLEFHSIFAAIMQYWETGRCNSHEDLRKSLTILVQVDSPHITSNIKHMAYARDNVERYISTA